MTENSKQLYKGIWPVLITPYNDDLSIDFSGYEKLLEWYISQNVHGIYANCQSSEMYELTEEERLKLISEAVRASHGKIPVVGTGNFGKDIDEHLTFIKKVSDAGAEVVMLTVPEFHNTDEELEKYYLTLAEKTNVKLGIYECPFPRRYYLGLDLIKKLAETGRFYAYKETSCEIEKIRSITSITNSTSFAHLQANVPYLLESLKTGTPGSMNIAANWLPDLEVKIYNLAQEGNLKADELNQILCGMELAQRSVHPMGVKYLISKRGVPIKPLTRYPRKLSLEEMYGLNEAAKNWFDQEGKLKSLL
ncbi:MAG: dihydrodipicolinate synthase family protein [Ignavibacteriae bacterium]|nr:dihydrodipicolinate synthase family protein [Ignavibacteriota bacterium]MCB0750842.1 dihydrodipicolinate synthase family protein [Ignavibacteriota bacterium]